DEHDLGVRISYAENSLRPRAGQMRTLCANANPFANRREQFRFVVSKALQSRERAFRRARQSITRLANFLQGRDDEIESRLLHSGRSSKVLRTAAIFLELGLPACLRNGHVAR